MRIRIVKVAEHPLVHLCYYYWTAFTWIYQFIIAVVVMMMMMIIRVDQIRPVPSSPRIKIRRL